MECLFKTTTKFTFEEYKKFNNAILLKKKNIITLVSLLIIMLICGIILENTFVIIFALVYPFLFVIIKNIGIKKTFNSNKLTQNIDVTYEFYDDYFIEKHENGEAKIPYNKLHEIIETKTNFYLMIAKNQGYMISKENMPEGLETFLQRINKH